MDGWPTTFDFTIPLELTIARLFFEEEEFLLCLGCTFPFLYKWAGLRKWTYSFPSVPDNWFPSGSIPRVREVLAISWA